MRQRSLEYRFEYGLDKRTGWTAVVDGRVIVQFVSFWRALWVFVFTKSEDY